MSIACRRRFVQSLATTVGTVNGLYKLVSAQPPGSHADAKGQLGVTTGSFTRHLVTKAEREKLVMLDLPKIMRDELGMRIIDLMTATLPSLDRSYLAQLREQAEKHGCLITNLKMNQPGIDMGSPDRAVRQHALDIYKQTIDAAHELGCRWVRPLPLSNPPSWDIYVDSYRQLIDYAGPKGITLLIENFGWIKGNPSIIPQLIAAVGNGLSACPDTGNWNDEVRYEGLQKAFPLAVTCDFKALALDAHRHHAAYDLQRCFQIGWDAGFRGPWCFEHFHNSLTELLSELVYLRDLLTSWIRTRS